MEDKDSKQLQPIAQDEAIRKIRDVYNTEYAPDSIFDVFEQLEICESLSEATHIKEDRNYKINNIQNNNVNENGNDTYKHRDDDKLNPEKHQEINELKTCNYRTPPIIITPLLKKLLDTPDTIPGHWLRIAQKWPPKAINGAINQMIKQQRYGWRTIDNPAGYFTEIIKFYKPRKSWLVSTNGIRKQQNEL